jgi:hypothetical protein
MRCPKCNYISFDEMEICGGCKKNISKYSQALHGVIFKADTPDFLWLQKPEEAPEEDVETAEAEADEEMTAPEDDDDAGLDMDLEAADVDDTVEFAADAAADEMELDLDSPAPDEEPQEIEFDLESDAADSGGQEEPQEMELDLPQEDEAPELDFSLDSGGAEADENELPELSMDGLDDLDMQLDDASSSVSLEKSPETKKAPPKKEKAAAAPEASLDLDEFDLSGLMPPAAGQDENIEELGGLSLESAEGADAGKSRKKDKKAGGEQELDLLSDLSVDGLDLDAPILPPASSAAGKKMRPAAKTGTALDSFDIDLGDLLGGSEKK